jgi:hypothetical protein
VRFIADLHHFSSPHPMDSGAALIRSPSFTGGGRPSQFARHAFSVTPACKGHGAAGTDSKKALRQLQMFKAA